MKLLKLNLLTKSVIFLLICFLMLSATMAGRLESGKNWISNELVKIKISESENDINNNAALCFYWADFKWNYGLRLYDNGSQGLSFHDEINENIEVKVEEGKSAKILFKKNDKKAETL